MKNLTRLLDNYIALFWLVDTLLVVSFNWAFQNNDTELNWKQKKPATSVKGHI